MCSQNKKSGDTLKSLLTALDDTRIVLDQAIEAGDADEATRLIKLLRQAAAQIDQIAE